MQQQEGITEVLANLSIGYIVAAALVLTVLRLLLAPSKQTFIRSVAELLESLLIAGVLVFMIIRPFFLQAFFIPSESMEPTLAGHNAGFSAGQNYPSSIHDHIFVDKLSFRFGDPKPDQIIVFRAPKEADMESPEHGRPQKENVLIKRVVAVGPCTVEVKQDTDQTIKVFVNGKPRNESHIKFLEPMEDMRGIHEFGVRSPLKLGADEIFVMGDNRNHSNDSRFWGPLKRDRVIGRARFTFWPIAPTNRLGLLR